MLKMNIVRSQSRVKVVGEWVEKRVMEHRRYGKEIWGTGFR